MSETAAIKKQLKIKTGSAKRLFKEQGLYQKEQEELQRKLDKRIAEDAEDWDIKSTRRRMEESGRMVVDSSTRLGDVVLDLRELVLAAEQDPELAEDPELIAAKGILEEVSV
ncbi:tubulin binding cofactor A [Epithele typhae]|uniref:tubulin binding cofactor A n=1 Tax=Epithele typhae TaxID=378194 RepID=UPI0020076FBD|nr:tubulin binding cofactor A [Epithele typhae]KAH9943994.1 tubulin binding cofactor A [Epithele typhae]